jgi:hypothetical protein
MLGAVGLAAVFVVVGIMYQVGVFGTPNHAISYHAIAFWGLALVALVGASFLRPRNS